MAQAGLQAQGQQHVQQPAWRRARARPRQVHALRSQCSPLGAAA